MLKKKVCLLIILSLGSQYIGRHLPYSSIASALLISESEVEKWLIDGMYSDIHSWSSLIFILVTRTRLFAGKLSQSTKSVFVIRSTLCTFRSENWKALENRLVMWQEGLSRVLEVVTLARRGGHAALSQ